MSNNVNLQGLTYHLAQLGGKVFHSKIRRMGKDIVTQSNGKITPSKHKINKDMLEPNSRTGKLVVVREKNENQININM